MNITNISFPNQRSLPLSLIFTASRYKGSFLIAAGSNVNHISHTDGISCLDVAKSENRIEVVEQLKAKGALTAAEIRARQNGSMPPKQIHGNGTTTPPTVTIITKSAEPVKSAHPAPQATLASVNGFHATSPNKSAAANGTNTKPLLTVPTKVVPPPAETKKEKSGGFLASIFGGSKSTKDKVPSQNGQVVNGHANSSASEYRIEPLKGYTVS